MPQLYFEGIVYGRFSQRLNLAAGTMHCFFSSAQKNVTCSQICKLMKYPRFLLAILFLAAFSACTETKTPGSAIEYNNQIVDIQYAVLGAFEKFMEAVDASDSLKAATSLESAIDSAKINAAKLEKMPDFEGSNDLKNDAKALIDFYVQSLDKEYREIYPILVDEDASLKELMHADSIKNVFTDREDELYNKLLRTQTAFAVKYKFDISAE